MQTPKRWERLAVGGALTLVLLQALWHFRFAGFQALSVWDVWIASVYPLVHTLLHVTQHPQVHWLHQEEGFCYYVRRSERYWTITFSSASPTFVPLHRPSPPPSAPEKRPQCLQGSTVTGHPGSSGYRGTSSNKKLLHSKGNNKQNGKQCTEWEKIFANHVFDKGLILRLYKELVKLNRKQLNK